jgi:hypothetical protein
VASDIPTAAGKLDKIVETIEAYVALQVADTGATQPMAQPSGEVVSSDAPAPPPEEKQES